MVLERMSSSERNKPCISQLRARKGWPRHQEYLDALPDTNAKGMEVRHEKRLHAHLVHAATLTTHHVHRIRGTLSPVRASRFAPESRPVDDYVRAGFRL